jgi:flavodoxin
MKTAVVYYSLDGNTAAAARELANILHADVYELKEKNSKRRGALNFMKSGMQATFNFRTRLVDDFKKQIAAYDTVYIGTPVWAGKSTPAVNAFINRADLAGKDVYIYFLCASPEADYRPKGIDYLSRIVGKKKGMLKGTYVWHGGAPNKPADAEAVTAQVRRSI